MKLDTRTANALAMTVCGVGFAVLYALAPHYADDLWYLGRYAATSTEAFVNACVEVAHHLQFDTGRLANIVSPPFLAIFPNWVFGILTGLMIMLTLHFGRKLMRASLDSLRFSAFIFFYVTCLPWMDYMMVEIFALNYVWSTGIGLAALWCVVSLQEIGRSPGVPARICLWVLMLVAGWMHEGMSVPLVCGLAAYDLALGRRLKLQPMVAQLFLLAGTIAIFCFPAIWNRMGSSQGKLLASSPMELTVIFGGFCLSVFLFVGAIAVAMFRRKIHSREQWAFAGLIFMFETTGMIILANFYGGPRVAWFVGVMGGIGFLWVIRWFTLASVKGWLRTLLAMAAMLAVAVNLGFAIAEQRKLSKEFAEVTALYMQSASGIVYRDITKASLTPSLMKTSVRNLGERIPVEQFSYHFKGNDAYPLTILPRSLEGFRPSNARLLTESPVKVWLYDNNLVAESESELDANQIEIEYKGKGRVSTRYRQIPFDTRYILIQPHSSLLMGSTPIEGAKMGVHEPR